MGSSFTKAMEPEELAVFKKLPTNSLLDNIEIPERAENRVRTDKSYLIAFGVTVLLLIPFLIYTLVYADFDRTHGYDPCGNICGKKNAKDERWACTGQDFTEKRYLEYEQRIFGMTETERLLTQRECVSQCPTGYDSILGICYPSYSQRSGYSFSIDDDDVVRHEDPIEKTSGIGTYLRKAAWKITLACFLSVGIALGALYLFRTATAAMVWSILIAVVVLGTILVGVCWYGYSQAASVENSGGILFACIFFTFLLIVLVCVMVFLHKKIQLVIALLKEAMKAAFAMPQLIFVPILTFIANLIIFALFLTTTAYMSTAGTLQELQQGFLAYELNFVMIFTIFFNVFITIWAVQFVVGIQYMVIAGAVSKWYFAKNKDYLDSPITTSAAITFKFHLGSIAFGSLIITIITIIRAIISSLTKNRALKICVDYFMSSIERFLKFLSKNSYILTAMHGKPFYKSGKRAAKIIFQNAINVASINFIGDFILAMAQLMVVFVTLLLTYAIMQAGDTTYANVVYAIVFIVSLAVACTFFAIFETVIDTIFLCFCEDSLLNDGMARPYAMSRDLMEFIDNAKKVFPEKKK